MKKYGVIPKEAIVLEKLEKLIGNPIPDGDSIDWKTFGMKIADEHVIGLGLYNRGLRTLPEAFGNLEYLQELNLNHNWLWSLPESFGNLNSLQVLD